MNNKFKNPLKNKIADQDIEQILQQRSQKAKVSKDQAHKLKEIERRRKPVQSNLPFDSIRDGIIKLKNGSFVKIYEITPINFDKRRKEEQDFIVSTLAEIYRIPGINKVHVKEVTKAVDPQRYINIIKNKIKKETNLKTIDMADNYIDLINRFSSGSDSAITRKFYFIVECPGHLVGGRYSEISGFFSNITTLISSKFNSMENTIANVFSSGDQIDEDESLYNILYSWFNPRTSINDKLSDRFKLLMDLKCKERGIDMKNTPKSELPQLSVNDLVGPRGLSFSDPDCFVMDGMYYTSLYVKSDGFPSGEIFPAWASQFSRAYGEGIEVDIFIERDNNTSSRVNDISRSKRLNSSSARTGNADDSDAHALSNLVSSSEYLLSKIQDAGESFFFFGLMITISATTKDELNQKVSFIKDNLQTQFIDVAQPVLKMQKVFESIMPVCDIHKDLFKVMKRNITELDLAAVSYLYTTVEIGDDDGVFMGINTSNGSMCIIDLFNTDSYKNANMVILGTSGAGKTFTGILFCLRMRITGIQVFILAPLKGHEFQRSCEAIGGSYINLKSSSPHRINIMDIRFPKQSTDYLLDGDELDEFGFSEILLIKKIQQLGIFFSLLIPNMDDEDESIMQQAILNAYGKKGILNDNSNRSLFVNPDAEILEFKKMPILKDVYEELINFENNGYKRIRSVRVVMEKFVKGIDTMFNGETNVDLDNKYTVLDISKVSANNMAIAMFVCIDYCWDIIQADRTEKQVIFIDETWILLNTNHLAANFVFEIFKTIRGYRGSAIAATQDFNDFYILEGGKYGKAIINNSAIKILLQLEEQEVEIIEDAFNLTNQERTMITKFQRGNGFLVANNMKVPISIEPSPLEFDLITTDGAQLSRISAEKNMQIENNISRRRGG